MGTGAQRWVLEEGQIMGGDDILRAGHVLLGRKHVLYYGIYNTLIFFR
jgi:hypothetical protein